MHLTNNFIIIYFLWGCSIYDIMITTNKDLKAWKYPEIISSKSHWELIWLCIAFLTLFPQFRLRAYRIYLYNCIISCYVIFGYSTQRGGKEQKEIRMETRKKHTKNFSFCVDISISKCNIVIRNVLLFCDGLHLL